MQTLLNAHTHSHNRKNVPVPLILQRKTNPIWFISEFIHIVHIASNVNCSLAWGNKFKRIHTYVHEWSGNRSLSPWEFHRSILSMWIENLYCSTHPVSRLTLSYFSQTEHHSYDNIEWCAAELSENDRMHKFIFYGNSHLKWVQNSNWCTSLFFISIRNVDGSVRVPFAHTVVYINMIENIFTGGGN